MNHSLADADHRPQTTDEKIFSDAGIEKFCVSEKECFPAQSKDPVVFFRSPHSQTCSVSIFPSPARATGRN